MVRAGAKDDSDTLLHQVRQSDKAGHQKTFDYVLADAEEMFSDTVATVSAAAEIAWALAANAADKAHSLADNVLAGSIFTPVDLPDALTPSPIAPAATLTPANVDRVLEYFSAAPSEDYGYAVEHTLIRSDGIINEAPVEQPSIADRTSPSAFQPTHDGIVGLDVALIRGEVPQPGRELVKVTKITDALSSAAVKAFNRLYGNWVAAGEFVIGSVAYAMATSTTTGLITQSDYFDADAGQFSISIAGIFGDRASNVAYSGDERAYLDELIGSAPLHGIGNYGIETTGDSVLAAALGRAAAIENAPIPQDCASRQEWEQAYAKYRKSLPYDQMIALVDSGKWAEGKYYWTRVEDDSDFAKIEAQHRAERAEVEAEGRSMGQALHDKWLAKDRAYRATVSGAFWTGFEAGSATFGQAVVHLVPFVDTYYLDKDTRAAWERSGLKGTWTEGASRLTIDLSLGIAAIAGGIEAAPYVIAVAVDTLPGWMIATGSAVANSTVIQTATTTVFVGVTYVEGKNAMDAANAGDMEGFANHANKSIFSGFGAVTSGYGLVKTVGSRLGAMTIRVGETAIVEIDVVPPAKGLPLPDPLAKIDTEALTSARFGGVGSSAPFAASNERWIGSLLSEEATQEAAESIARRISSLRSGGYEAINEVRIVGSRATGWSVIKNRPPLPTSDVDIAINDWAGLRGSRFEARDFRNARSIADEFEAATGLKVELHVRSGYTVQEWETFFGGYFRGN